VKHPSFKHVTVKSKHLVLQLKSQA